MVTYTLIKHIFIYRQTYTLRWNFRLIIISNKII